MRLTFDVAQVQKTQPKPPSLSGIGQANCVFHAMTGINSTG
jgi:hypothetical protein